MRIQLIFLFCISNSLHAMEKQNSLVEAALSNNVLLIQQLVEIEETDPNKPNQHGVFPLIAAYNNGQRAAFEKLLALKANPGIKIKDAPLLVQSVVDNQFLFFKMILEAKPELNSTDCWGETALMKAAKYGRKAFVTELVIQRANTTLKDNNGNTAQTLCMKSLWIVSNEIRTSIAELLTSPHKTKKPLVKANTLSISV